MGQPKAGKYKRIEPGTRKNSLTFLEELPKKDKHGRYFVRCRCDCGAETTIRKNAFLTGKTKSCGCKQLEAVRKTNEKKRGVYGWSCFKNVFQHYRRGAATRGLAFELDEQTFHAVAQQSCRYCGMAPSLVEKQKSKHGEYVYNGLDRVDNTRGYFSDNVVAACKVCNYAKRTMTADEFKAWIIRVHAHMVVTA